MLNRLKYSWSSYFHVHVESPQVFMKFIFPCPCWIASSIHEVHICLSMLNRLKYLWSSYFLVYDESAQVFRSSYFSVYVELAQVFTKFIFPCLCWYGSSIHEVHISLSILKWLKVRESLGHFLYSFFILPLYIYTKLYSLFIYVILDWSYNYHTNNMYQQVAPIKKLC